MSSFKLGEIFVPGGMPSHTYVNRKERQLEEQLLDSVSTFKLVVLTGMTKSGKTVLVNRIFPRDSAIWIDGGTVAKEDDLWATALKQMGGHTSVTKGKETSDSAGVGISAGAQLKIPLVFGTNASGEAKVEHGISKSDSESLDITPRASAIAQLRSQKTPLIIDDFHYIDRELQGTVIRALKSLIFDGVPVVLIAIPHRRYDAVKVEREMTGRLQSIQIPAWEQDELSDISRNGFPLLNASITDEVTCRLAAESFGSPHLMQEFCSSLAIARSLRVTAEQTVKINTIDDALFRTVAEGTGKTIYDQLARGPRQRSDRMQRKLKVGGTADIYRVVLLALSKLQPGLSTVSYEEIRSRIREILESDIPQAGEVTRVLEKMSELAATDEASTPVLDWEKDQQILHITDPFFAFYLRWGAGSN